MLKVLSSILCDLDPKVKVIGQKAGICDGLPSTSALVLSCFCLFALMFCVAANIFAVPCPPRLNQYLAENKVSCLGHYKVLPGNFLKIAIL